MNKECRELQDKLSAFLDGECEGEDFECIQKHLEHCDCCRRCLETLSVTRDALKKLAHPAPSPELKERIKACLREKCQGHE